MKNKKEKAKSTMGPARELSLDERQYVTGGFSAEDDSEGGYNIYDDEGTLICWVESRDWADFVVRQKNYSKNVYRILIEALVSMGQAKWSKDGIEKFNEATDI